MKKICPLCESENLQAIFEAKDAFISVAELSHKPFSLEKTKEKHKFKGDLKIKLFQCKDCAYTFNALFNEEKMNKAYFSGSYITPRAISGAISKFIESLSAKIKTYAKEDDVFLEVAPGGCDLLFALAKNSKFCYSIDPSFTPEILLKDLKNVSHIRALFSYKEVANKLKHKINFIIFRHLLEHLKEPARFLKDIVRLLEDDGIIYVEVPNMLELTKNKRIYEIRHEHVGYHQEANLIKVFESLDCGLLESFSIHDEQWLGMFFKKGLKTKKELKPVFFGANLNKDFYDELERLNISLKPYKNIALYGAGSHANSLLSYLSLENCEKISRAIDKDERRENTYLLHSDIVVKTPSVESLKGVDCILMATPAYEDVIFKNEILAFTGGGD